MTVMTDQFGLDTDRYDTTNWYDAADRYDRWASCGMRASKRTFLLKSGIGIVE
eukprot:SAG11_NODE_7876_length_1090_cov_6.397566_1_plen_53_part_00